jgi:hypothetical protein
MGDMWFRAVPVVAAGRLTRKGDEVAGNLKVPQPARRRRGVTLIEAVLYIAIALALIVGGLVFYQQATLQSRVNYVTRSLAAVFADARTLNDEMNGAGHGHLENLLFARGSIPAELWDATKPSGQRLRFPFGTAYASISATFMVTGQSVYDLSIRNIDVRMCARLVRSTPQGETLFASGFAGGAGSFVTEFTLNNPHAIDFALKRDGFSRL